MARSSRSRPRAASGSSRTPARRSGACDAEGRRSARAATSPSFAFYANKQMTTGEGGMLAVADPELAARLRSERNQGRAPDMDWVDHDRLGFNYRLSEIQAALGVAQLERLDAAARRRAARRRPLRRAPRRARCGAPAGEGDPDGLVLPCADRGARAAQLVRLRRAPAGGGRPRRGGRRPRSARGRGKGLHALRSTCCATTASASASARASSRSPRTPRRACWRCPSSRRSARRRSSASARRSAEALRRRLRRPRARSADL